MKAVPLLVIALGVAAFVGYQIGHQTRSEISAEAKVAVHSSSQPSKASAPEGQEAGQEPTLDEQKRIAGKLEADCRSGPNGPRSPGDGICLARDKAIAALKTKGWCWAYSDPDVGVLNYDWHRCSQARPTDADFVPLSRRTPVSQPLQPLIDAKACTAPQSHVSCDSVIFKPVWASYENDNGTVFKVAIGEKQRSNNGGYLVPVYEHIGAAPFSFENMRDIYFMCNHQAQILGGVDRPGAIVDIPPRSTMSSVERDLCGK